jgi:hypothetical protein
MSVEEELVQLRVCTEKCDYSRKHGQKHRKKHLNDCLSWARDMKDSKKECEISDIIKGKKIAAFGDI